MTRKHGVTLLGLGFMGHALAERLLDQGFQLTVWNRTPEKAGALHARGATLAPSPSEAAKGADVVALCLRDGPAAEEVLFGKDGVAESLRAPTVVLDFSTLGVEPTQRLASRLNSETGGAWVDAPVSGGPSAARAGTLTIFLGGTEGAISKVKPVLEAVARRCTPMGTLGAGQATKLCNQLIASTTMLAVAEAISAARAFGLDADMVPTALTGGYADSLPLQIFGPRMASQLLEPQISEIALMRKDVIAVLDAASRANVKLPLMEAVLGLYDRAIAQGLGPQDLGALVRIA